MCNIKVLIAKKSVNTLSLTALVIYITPYCMIICHHICMTFYTYIQAKTELKTA